MTNALRAHLAEFGVVAPAGAGGRAALFAQVRGERLDELPDRLRLATQGLLEAIERSIVVLDQGLATAAKTDAASRRLLAAPGIGVLTASALVAHAGDARQFKSARHFVAWLGMAPRVTIHTCFGGFVATRGHQRG